MTKEEIKIQIKSIFGKVLFEYECEENTVAKTVTEAVKKEADLRSANLRYADLSSANLSSIKNDFWDVLIRAIPEIPNLRKAIIEGKIDGSTYDGECACLCGTLEHSEKKEIKQIIFDQRDSSRPIERLFLGINKGDTPETNQISKIVLAWVDEFTTCINRFK
jgi:hypothetical protein